MASIINGDSPSITFSDSTTQTTAFTTTPIINTINSQAATPLTFGINATEAGRFDTNGALCVGITAPVGTTKLTVSSSNDLSAWIQSTSAATTGVVSLFSAIPSTAFNTSCAHFGGQTSGVNTYFLYGNGTTSYASDINLKKNVVTTRNGYLDDLAKLRVVKYQWKVNTDDSPTELGLIAQEVAEVFPNLVKDSIPAKEGDPTNKVILGSVFQTILIKCVQELNTQLKELTAKVEALTPTEAQVSAKQSAMAKLSALGLTEDEVKALIGQ
jgi:hypothetical protein